MKRPGQIVLVPFPYADLSSAKLRPALLLRKASARFDDWLICMVSSQLQQEEADLDELLSRNDPDFAASGLKADSIIRIRRLAVVEGALLAGTIGELTPERLGRIRHRLADWIGEEF
ncbi:MAG: type II toxin-antitoxin system PemK/MazF family toxin [Rhodospirillales bacterium]|nr:type II toxin-antitoxin system PemK/MazF family toxin [Rhodospirillales bacterium]